MGTRTAGKRMVSFTIPARVTGRYEMGSGEQSHPGSCCRSEDSPGLRDNR